MVNMGNAIIAKISRGSKMDQIYLPKNRIGMPAGEYVVVSPAGDAIKKKEQKRGFKPYFYNANKLEPLKLSIIQSIFNIIESIKPDNIIITGSFLEKGFIFNDIDILIIKEEKINNDAIKNRIEEIIGIKSHIISLNYKTLLLGLSTDPLYNMMLSKCISKNRIIFKAKRQINYKLLDLHLLKSRALTENFDILNGNEKYYLALNLIAIKLFIENKKLSKDIADKNIEKEFNIKISDIKENTLEKKEFIKKYSSLYNRVFNLIMERIK